VSFPVWAWVTFFVLVPFGLVLWYSFGYKPDLFSAVSNDQLSLDRYREVTDPTFLSTFWNTLRIAGLGTVLCLLIGLPFAYWLGVKTHRAGGRCCSPWCSCRSGRTSSSARWAG
jgi:spermidine/putrescine transport system permease protein